MSAAEFGLHWADYQRHPWGDMVVEVMGGMVAATIANVHRGRDTSPFRPLDFMPFSAATDDEPEEEPRGINSAASLFAAMNAAFDAYEGKH